MSGEKNKTDSPHKLLQAMSRTICWQDCRTNY